MEEKKINSEPKDLESSIFPTTRIQEIEQIAWLLYQSGIKVQWNGPKNIKEFRIYHDYQVWVKQAKKIYEKEIERLSWQVFQDRLQLRFKMELTQEEKKKITDDPTFNRYREEAKNIYKKRLTKKIKALDNKKYPVIDIPADGKSGIMGGAYTLCFVYSKYNGNFILRGYMREVEEYLKKNYTHYFCNFSLWYHGNNRDIWKFWKEGIYITQPNHKRSKFIKPQHKFWVGKYSDSYLTDEKNEERRENRIYFKRLPKCWIPEFDNF